MDENNHNVEAQQQTEENDETTRCQYCDAVKDEDELVECCECTNRMCDDCAHHCADCDTPICEDCAHTCERCDDIICDECSRWYDGCDWRYCGDCLEYCEECGASYCTSCMEEYHDHEDTQEPDYIDPYHSNAKARNVFTFGLEIEIGADHDHDHDHDHDMMQTNPLIAGWCPDGSLYKHGALEYQTQPMTMNQVDELTDLVARIEPVDDNSQAGGHMHISRADRQTPGRWYWALHALNKEQAESLNMRHMTETRWCQLMRGEYNGEATAINTHTQTPSSSAPPARGGAKQPTNSRRQSPTCIPCGGSSNATRSTSSNEATAWPPASPPTGTPSTGSPSRRRLKHVRDSHQRSRHHAHRHPTRPNERRKPRRSRHRMVQRPTTAPLSQSRQPTDPRPHTRQLGVLHTSAVPSALPSSPHGQVCEENTHPFKFRKDGRTGFIAHNGIARSYTQGRFESDSRNAILAWQTGQCDLTNGSQGKFALIDQTGQIEWLTQDHQTIKGQSGLITVSNTNWELSSMTDLDLWDE